MEEQAKTRNITLKDLWEIFVQRLWVMILISVIVTGGLLLIIKLTFVPEYSSTATLYILKQENSAMTTTSSDSDFSLALKVVNDCDYLLKSHSVVDDVIKELDLGISYERLSRSIRTSNPENTRILEVTVTAASPEEAKRIVDTLCEIGQDKITEAMGFQQVNLFEYGTLKAKPSNHFRNIYYVIIAVLSALVTYVCFVIAYLLDDRIRTDEDIDRYGRPLELRRIIFLQEQFF